MTLFWLGVLIGGFVGACIGLLMFALVHVGSCIDDMEE
jgi:hypothetical protein